MTKATANIQAIPGNVNSNSYMQQIQQRVKITKLLIVAMYEPCQLDKPT